MAVRTTASVSDTGKCSTAISWDRMGSVYRATPVRWLITIGLSTDRTPGLDGWRNGECWEKDTSHTAPDQDSIPHTEKTTWTICIHTKWLSKANENERYIFNLNYIVNCKYYKILYYVLKNPWNDYDVCQSCLGGWFWVFSNWPVLLHWLHPGLLELDSQSGPTDPMPAIKDVKDPEHISSSSNYLNLTWRHKDTCC